MNPTMKDIRECKVCGGKTRRCNYKGPRGGKCKNYRNCQDYRTCSYNEELQPCPHCNGTGYELIVTQRETNLSPDYVFCHISRKFRDAIFVNDEKLWVRIPLKIMVDEIVVVACDGSKVTLKVTDIQVKDNIITYIWGVKQGPQGRFDICLEKHIGFGIRWDSCAYQLDISIAIMCVTINIGLGENLQG